MLHLYFVRGGNTRAIHTLLSQKEVFQKMLQMQNVEQQNQRKEKFNGSGHLIIF